MNVVPANDWNLGQRAARGALSTLIAQGLILLVRIGSIIVLARFIALESFAVVAVGVSFATLSASIVTMGIPMAVLQASPLSDSTRCWLTLINTGLGVIIALILVAVAWPLADAYDMPELFIVMLSLSMVPLLTGLAAQSRTQLLVDLRFGLVSAVESGGVVLAALIALLLALHGADYEALVVQAVVATLVPSLLFLGLARPTFVFRRHSSRELTSLLRTARAIFATNLVRNAARSSLLPVLGLSVPPAALGAFDRAQQLAVLPINMAADQLQRVVVPVLTRVRDDESRLLSMLATGQTLLSLLLSVLYLSLASVAQPLTVWALGSEWEVAGQLLSILAVGAVFRCLAQTAQWLFLATGNADRALRFNLWSQPMVLVGSLAGLPWGVQGVAVANALTWAVLWPCALLATSRLVSRSPWALGGRPFRAVVTVGIPSGIAGLAGQFLIGTSLLSVGASLAFACIAAMLATALSRTWRLEFSNAKRLIAQR